MRSMNKPLTDEQKVPKAKGAPGIWNPVSGCLPTHIHSVLGWIVGPESITMGKPFADVVIYNEHREQWQCGAYGENGDDADVEVSHWMGMPEQPK